PPDGVGDAVWSAEVEEGPLIAVLARMCLDLGIVPMGEEDGLGVGACRQHVPGAVDLALGVRSLVAADEPGAVVGDIAAGDKPELAVSVSRHAVEVKRRLAIGAKQAGVTEVLKRTARLAMGRLVARIGAGRQID